MPLIESDEDYLVRERLLNLANKQDEEDPTTAEIIGALWRQENTLGSLLNQDKGLPDGVSDRDFNPVDYLTEEELLNETLLDRMVDTDTEDEIEAVRRQYAREMKDRDTLRRGGWKTFALGIGVSGIGDPISLIPVGGALAKTYKTGNSILSAGVITGSVTSASTALQEAALHNSQITRTLGESAINVSASALLGGTLGASFSGVMKSVDRAAIQQIENMMDVEGKIARGENAIISPEYLPTAKERKAFKEGSLSAMEATVADVQISGGKVRKFLRAIAFDPLTRTMTSLNPVTRRVTSILSENVYKTDGPAMQAVSTQIASRVAGLNAEVEMKARGFYQTFRKNGHGNRAKFNEEVSRALRHGNSEIPEVLAAANVYRNDLYDPLLRELQQAKLLPEDVEVKTASGYLNRIYDQAAIQNNLGEFRSRISTYLRDKDAALRNEASNAQARLDSEELSASERSSLEALVSKSEYKEGLDIDYDYLASEIASRILESPAGRLPYDWKIGEGSSITAGKSETLPGARRIDGVRGPLRQRVFQIPDKDIEDFLVNDVQVLSEAYSRSVISDLEFKRAFSDLNLTEELKEITRWWDDEIAKMDPATQSKQIKKMVSQKNADLRDILGMKDRIRGNYGRIDPNNLFDRMGQTIMELNYMRHMGGVVAASIPDVARVVMAEGVTKTFSGGLIPLVTNLSAVKVASKEARQYGIGVDVLTGLSRSKVMSDVFDSAQPRSGVERGVRYLADRFGRVNMMDYWTSGMKTLHTVVMQNRVIDDLLKGKIDKRLNRLGIDDINAQAIAEQLKKYATKVDNKVWIANHKNWDSAALKDLWRNALYKESNRVIVTPGQELPLFMSRPVGRVFMQFRSFMLSSTQRMTVAALQGQDHNALAGVVSLTAMGMLSYYFKQWDADREISNDPLAVVVEGIDRSGALGILMEANNTIEKITSNNVGLRPLLGVSAPASRFVSRSIHESILGPTAGTGLRVLLTAMNAPFSQDGLDESDVRTFRRLLPYQNLSVLRQAFDYLEEQIGDLL